MYIFGATRLLKPKKNTRDCFNVHPDDLLVYVKQYKPTHPSSWLEVSQLRELSPEPILLLLGGWLPSLDSSSVTSSCRGKENNIILTAMFNHDMGWCWQITYSMALFWKWTCMWGAERKERKTMTLLSPTFSHWSIALLLFVFSICDLTFFLWCVIIHHIFFILIFFRVLPLYAAVIPIFSTLSWMCVSLQNQRYIMITFDCFTQKSPLQHQLTQQLFSA